MDPFDTDAGTRLEVKGLAGVTRCLEDHPRTNGSAVDLPSIVFVPLRDQVVNPFRVAYING